MHSGDIVFVEVKSRKSDEFGSPEEAVGITKQRKFQKWPSTILQERDLLTITRDLTL